MFIYKSICNICTMHETCEKRNWIYFLCSVPLPRRFHQPLHKRPTRHPEQHQEHTEHEDDRCEHIHEPTLACLDVITFSHLRTRILHGIQELDLVQEHAHYHECGQHEDELLNCWYQHEVRQREAHKHDGDDQLYPREYQQHATKRRLHITTVCFVRRQ